MALSPFLSAFHYVPPSLAPAFWSAAVLPAFIRSGHRAGACGNRCDWQGGRSCYHAPVVSEVTNQFSLTCATSKGKRSSQKAMPQLNLSNITFLPGLVLDTTSRADKQSGQFRGYDVFHLPSSPGVYFTFRMQFVAKGGSILTLGTIEELVRNSSLHMLTRPALDKLMRVAQSQLLKPEYAECEMDHWHCENPPLARAIEAYWESARRESALPNLFALTALHEGGGQ